MVLTCINLYFTVHLETIVCYLKIKYVPVILISALGYTICPCSGRNTYGIFCTVVPDTNEAKEHSENN